MGNETPDSDAPLARRRFLQMSALGAAAVASADWSQGAQAAPAASSAGAGPRATTNPVQARAPLAPAPFVALPLGSVRARGWLLRQLELQRDGLTGHAEEVLPATAPDSAWKGGDGEDWEKGPYYLKGLVPLAYTLDDAALKAKAAAWIEPILASQREDGFFGPRKNNDWWPRMVATYLLRDYQEASGDERVLPFLLRYYRHMSTSLPGRPLGSWGKARAGDEIDTVLWLYNRTGEAFLLGLSDLLAEQAYPWRQILTENRFFDYDFMTRHNVNVPQALKMPAVYSQRSGRAEDRAAYRAGLSHLMRDHGTAFGINTGAEPLSGRSTTEGVELCSVVEYMLSAETALRILGDARIGDELELVAFNALPAALSHDIRQHVYYTLANTVNAPRGTVGFRDDHGDDRSPAPRSGFPCCCYNFHMGWPKLAQAAWAATAGGGLAVLAYVPSQVLATVAGQEVSITCDTHYPFEESVTLTVSLPATTRFPLQLRVPAWCQQPQVRVNGAAQPRPTPGTFATIERAWQDGDRVDILFPMSVQAVRGVNDSASVRRGPLVFSLALSENWKSVEKGKLPGFDSYEVASGSPWNYALLLSPQDNGKAAFEVVTRAGGPNPFESGKSPVTLRARGKRLESWGLRFDGQLPHDPPPSPVASAAPSKALELVPFGSQMLRITSFPVIGTPRPAPAAWSEDFEGDYSQRWLVQHGSFVRDSQLHLPQGAKGTAPRALFGDCVFEGEVAVGKSGDAGLIFRASDLSVGVDHFLGYYVGLNAEAKAIVFGRFVNDWQPLASARGKIRAGQVHRVRIEARGAQFRVWVDEMSKPVLEARDDSFASGAVGVRSYSSSAAFGKLRARAL